MPVPNSPRTFSRTPAPSGADGRLGRVRNLIRVIKDAADKPDQSRFAENKAIQLAHLLRVSKRKDRFRRKPAEWKAAAALVANWTVHSNVAVRAMDEEEIRRWMLVERRKSKAPPKCDLQQLPPEGTKGRALRRFRLRKKAKKKVLVKGGRPKLVFSAFETNRRRQ